MNRSRSSPDYLTDNFDSDIELEVLRNGRFKKPGSSTYEGEGCRRCGKLDPIMCLKAGSALTVDARRIRVDWGLTLDDQTVVSTRLLEALRALPGVSIDAYPIGSGQEPSHWVVWPVRVFPPQPIAPKKSKKFTPFPANVAFRSEGPKCSDCGRFRITTFNLLWASLPVDIVLAGIELEKSGHTTFLWVFNAGVADVMKQVVGPRCRFRPLENRPSS